MGNLIENRIIFDLNKARTGRYEDNSKNRRLHRVGQEYGNKGGEKEDEKSSEKKDDNSSIIQALESKIEQMKKNKHIFVEQGGEVRYNRALETLQSKLDSAKGEERKESVRDKASEKKEKTDSDYEKVNEASRKRTAQKNKKIDEAIKDGAIPVGNGSVGKIMSTGVDGTLTVSFTDGKEEWNDKVQPGSSIYWALFDSDKFPREAAVRRRDYLMGLYHETKSSASAKAYKKEIDRISEKIGKSQEEKDMEADRKTEGKSEDGSDLRSDFKNKFLENPALALTYSTLSDHGTTKDDLVGKEVAKQVMGNKKFKEKFRKELSALGYAKYLGLTPYKYESTGFADNLKDFSSKEIAEKLNVKDGETKEFSLKDSFIRTPGMGNGSLFSYDKMIVSMKNGRPTVTLSGKYQSGYKDNEIKDIKEGIGVLSKNQKETVLNLIEDKASEAGDGKAEEKEPFTRVKFDDLPNSGKVNLKKYLSGKRREKIDSQWKDAGKISDADLKKMEAGLVKKFNDSFDSSSKSQRAEDLYNIMKVKGELQKRGNETKKDGKTKSQENSKEKSMVMNISDDDLKVNSSLKSSSKRRAVLKKVYKIINDIYGDNGYRLENGELNPEWYESNNYLFNRASKINNL